MSSRELKIFTVPLLTADLQRMQVDDESVEVEVPTPSRKIPTAPKAARRPGSNTKVCHISFSSRRSSLLIWVPLSRSLTFPRPATNVLR